MNQHDDYSSNTEVDQSSTPVDLYQTTGSSPPVTADEAQAIGQAIAAGADHLWQLLKRAEAGRVWEPLGLPDLPAFVARYVPAEHRRPLVTELRSEGMSTGGIATATGVSQAQVRRDLDKVRPPVSPDTDLVNPTVQLTPDAPVLRNIGTVTGTDGKTYKASRPKKAKKPRKQTRAESRAHLEDLAARVRAAQPEAQLAACREACVKCIEAQGWHEFSKLSRDLAEAYAEEVTVS